jgi:hypothetical protein
MFVVFTYPQSSANYRVEDTLRSSSAPREFADGNMASKSANLRSGEDKSADLYGRAAA